MNAQELQRLADLVTGCRRFPRGEKLDWFKRNFQELHGWMRGHPERETPDNCACLARLAQGLRSFSHAAAAVA